MDDIIEKLYDGTLNACEDIYKLTDDKLYNECSKIMDDIKNLIGRELFDKLDAARSVYVRNVSLHSFEYGLKTGIRLAAADDGHPP